MPRIENEDELLNQEIRKKIIDDLEGPENQGRKDEHYKRHQCLNERTKNFVVTELLKQLDSQTVEEMQYCLSNIPITRKIIGKLARVYNNGVKRTVHKIDAKPDASKAPVLPDDGNADPKAKPTKSSEPQPSDDATKQIEELSEILELDTNMKKTNKYTKLHKTCAVFIKPVPDMADEIDSATDGDGDKWRIKPVVMAPYLYDVIEQFHDREKALCYVFSHYNPSGGGASSLLATNIARAGRAFLTPTIKPEGDNRDEITANSPSDKDKESKEYIFWSAKYHFTCNGKGEIIKSNIGENDSPTPDNPIGMLPIKEFSVEQDGTFWPQGGGSLVDGDILINALLTHIFHIGVTQGYGQFWARGPSKLMPKQFKVGPTKAIVMEMTSKDDPIPEIGFAKADPPLNDMMKMVEMYAAFLLTSNNLTATSISSRLDTMKNEASGIALIIDKAESTEDVKEQEQVFVDAEPDLFKIIAAWLNYFGAKDLLCEELVPFKDLPQDMDLRLKFGDSQPIMSETEKLANIETRAQLGINTIVELLMKDDPNLNEEQAEERVQLLIQDRQDNAELWDVIDAAQPVQLNIDPADGGTNMDNVSGVKPKPGKAKPSQGGPNAGGTKATKVKTGQAPNGSSGGSGAGPGP